MSRLRPLVADNPIVRKLRHIAETVVTPRVRVDLATQHERLNHADHVGQITQDHTGQLQARVDEIERHMPRLLNVISSGDGAARLLRREIAATSARFDEMEATVNERAATIDALVADAAADSAERVATLSGSVSDLSTSVAGHAETQAWLLQRVETIRAEMLHELRYGRDSSPSTSIDVNVVDPSALTPADGALRLNLGCGHKPLDGFANIDMREIPGVDVVAPVDELPVEAGSVAEIFSAHLLEHFPEEDLRRRLLPYWVGLLRPGGVFRAVVPDMGAMATELAEGRLDFDVFRSVTYGGQEYEGDTHFNGFTADHLRTLLEGAGLVDVEIVATGRPEGDCLELEIAAARPS